MKLSEAAIWHMPGLMAIKDKQSRYVMANKSSVELLAYHDLDQLIGKCDYELPDEVAQHAEAFEQEDKLTLQYGKLKTLTMMRYPDQRYHVWFTDKFAVYDNAGNAYQCGFRSLELPSQVLPVITALDSTIAKTKEQGFTFTLTTETYRPFDFSDQHYSVLFYFLRDMSVKQIAYKISHSIEQVIQYVEDLLNYFQCKSYSQLKEYALTYQLQHLLPGAIFDL